MLHVHALQENGVTLIMLFHLSTLIYQSHHCILVHEHGPTLLSPAYLEAATGLKLL